MYRVVSPLTLLLAVAAVLASGPVAFGQADKPAGKRHYRQLAPGVMTTIPPEPQVEETVSRHDVVELLAVDPTLTWAKDVTFRQDIWALAFQFKPVRMIWVDMPQPSGKLQRKLIWYLVYSVTNPGKILHPVREENGTFTVEKVDRAVRFVPEFLLESVEFQKVYPDRVIPIAIPAIRLREDPNRELLTTVQMCRDIKVGQTLWGVATWEDIDPRIDSFSVYVQGLTNAYRWKDTPEQYTKGAPLGTGRRLAQKTLKLNFWRPGDEFYQNEREIRLGVPAGVDYEWVYR